MGIRAARLLIGAILVLGVSACASVSQKKDPLASNVIDEANLNQLMLTASDPKTAVEYFQKALAKEPDRADFRRGLARSLERAQQYNEAARVFKKLVALGQDEPVDRIDYALVAIHLDHWDVVRSMVARFPNDLNTPRRYMIEAMVADQDKNWKKADELYAKAVKLSPQPAALLNNWGVSQMARGDLNAAQKSFEQAVSYDSTLFSAKNNLAIARGLQGHYTLPLVPLKDKERAVLLNNLGIIAMRKGDEKTARGLFAAAVDADPQHYAGAADKLAALEANVAY